MQPLLIVALVGALFVGVLVVAGVFNQPVMLALGALTGNSTESDTTLTPPRQASQPTAPEQATTTRPTRTANNAVSLEIGRVVTWASAPIQIPLWVQGNPQELDFVIRFPSHLVRVLSVSSSSNWNADIVRLNGEGEIRVHAVRKKSFGGKERLLLMRFHRVDSGRASITIPVAELEARFASDEPYDVRVDPGLLATPF